RSITAQSLEEGHQTNALVVEAEGKTVVDTWNTGPADSHLVFVIHGTITVEVHIFEVAHPRCTETVFGLTEVLSQFVFRVEIAVSVTVVDFVTENSSHRMSGRAILLDVFRAPAWFVSVNDLVLIHAVITTDNQGHIASEAFLVGKLDLKAFVVYRTHVYTGQVAHGYPLQGRHHVTGNQNLSAFFEEIVEVQGQIVHDLHVDPVVLLVGHLPGNIRVT